MIRNGDPDTFFEFDTNKLTMNARGGSTTTGASGARIIVDKSDINYPLIHLKTSEDVELLLDNDGNKLFESLFDGLFPNHQYGQQTTIGTIEHLKNPSLTEIRKYFNKYYVPNNMAICLSGDFDYDETIRLINKYWRVFERKDNPKHFFKFMIENYPTQKMKDDEFKIED